MNKVDKLIEEISIKGGGVMQMIRQPDNSKLNEGDLVFIYPIIMDAMLEKQYGNLIRDFVTVAFINRIKRTNILNVVSDAVSPGTVKSGFGSGEINPAQLLKKHLGRAPQDEVQPDDILAPSEIDYAKKGEYEGALSQLREYVKDQIQNDPQYSQLRPVISQVMANNLIPIPLIIGTNMMKVHSSVLFWILFIASGQKIPLDRSSSLDKIKPLLRQIPVDKYETFMKGTVHPSTMDTPRKLHQTINSIWDQTDKAVNLKFGLVLNEQKWNQEVGVNSFTAQLTTAMHNTQTSQGAMSRRASTAFKNFIGNEIVGILQSITHAIIPETELNISTRLSSFVDKSTNVRSHYDTIYDYIIGGSSNIDEIEELIKVSTDICKENTEINVNNVMSQLGSLHFGMTGKKRTGGFMSKFSVAGNSGELLSEFTEDLVGVGATLASFSKKLEEYIRELGGEQAVQQLSEYKKGFSTEIRNYFEGGWDTAEGGITSTNIDREENRPDQDIINMFSGRNIDHTGGKSLFNSKRFQQLTGQLDSSGNLIVGISSSQQTAFEDNMYNSLTEIMHFLSVFCFMSFFCDYLREIETEVTVQKRDAVSFPNYVLTIRLEYITRIYWALATRNFENEMTQEKDKEREEEFNEKRDWKGNKVKEAISNEIDSLEKELKKASDYQKRRIQLKIDELEKKLHQPTPKQGVELEQFRIGSMSDITKQINLIKERLKIPNIVVIDEKNKKVYYRLMFMPRVMNLDLGTMNSYVSQQKDALKGF